MRIIIKGGVWKNTEDEILKAAISKYGKNQWARISSLLVRKTPKQCKARWYEWLDPSIKKTEWSKEEDEKLLHLAKLMPTQWRTIAPIVGRTATQCLERYQKLLDEAEARDNEESGLGLTGPGGPEAGPSAEDVRRLRPGEIDPDPETKPARPDPIDMDEDEKEMLSEARARLANTQGKKAKRKARERALEEARRLAMLQKRRELKAAGIIMRHKQKKKGMDYSADIPFEKKPATGFYDTSEENTKSYRAPVGQTLRSLENKRRPENEEAEARKRAKRDADKEKQAKGGDPFAGAKDEQIRRLREAEQISKRRKLVLPDAQVGEGELEAIVKLGQAGETARGLVEGSGNEASEGLLGDYSALERAKHARTPRTAPQDDNVMREARNLRAMTSAQTPLLGEENTPMHDGGTRYEGATPRTGVAATPNPLLTPARGEDPSATPYRGGPSATPRTEVSGVSGVGRTPMRTPLRDNLGLNTEEMSAIGDTPRSEKYRAAAARRELRESLRGLPAPKNDFDLVLDGEDAKAAEDEFAGVPSSEEDAAERDARLAAMRAEEERKALARRSQAVQRGLPRPANIDAPSLLRAFAALPTPSAGAEGDALRAQRLVDEEMVRLLEHDSIVHPVPGSKHAGGGKSNLPILPDSALEDARAEVHKELAAQLGFPGANPAALARLTAAQLEDDPARLEAFEAALEAERKNTVWDATRSAWVDASELDAHARIAGLAARLEQDKGKMATSAAAAAKGEKKLATLLGGYQVRARALRSRTTDAFTALQEAAMAHAAFTRLAAAEEGAARSRLDKLTEEVGRLQARENMAQGRYRELDEERRLRKEEVERLQHEIEMREAEAMNEAALATEEAEEEEDVGPMPAKDVEMVEA